MPQVCVIIPTYNRAIYLAQAVNSVLSQSFTDFEIVVVDDGSTDKTAEIIRSFRDPRLSYVYQPNAGRSAARNRGLASSISNYVAFLDDDDQYLPDKLSSQVAFLEQHPDVDLVASGVEMIDHLGNPKGYWRMWEDQPELRLETCVYSCPLMPSVILLRRRMLETLDHWFDPKLEPAEDVDFFIRLQLAGCCMAWDHQILAMYRLHDGSSQNDGVRYSQAYQTMLDNLFDRPGLPESLKVQQTHIRAHYSLVGACRCYAKGQVDVAQQDLQRALTLEPGLVNEEFPTAFATTIVGIAESLWVANPLTYINLIFSHLPSSLASLAILRSETLSTMYMARVFRANSAGLPFCWKDWWQGVYYAPRWLRNRGVWSILFKSLIWFR